MLKKLVLLAMILTLCLNVAYASSWEDAFSNTTGDDLFWLGIETELDSGELGDESMPLYVLGGMAVMLAGGCAYAHQRRKAVDKH